MSLKVLRAILGVVATITVGVIIWIDIATDIWQKYVVIAGLAAGLVTFVLTALVIDRVIARSTHERWAPVTRLALGDLRRRLAAGDRATVRRLPTVDTTDSVDVLVAAAAAEHERMSAVLARWVTFLSASADVTDIMDAIAEVTERLDSIDTTAVAIGTGATGTAPAASMSRLIDQVDAYHRAGDRLLTHIDDVLHRYRAPDEPATPR